MCASSKYAAEDRRLNKTYNEYRRKLNTEQKRQLTQVQLTWMKYRDQECAFEASSSEGASTHTLAITLCKNDKTTFRIRELEILSNCKDGDANCPAK